MWKKKHSVCYILLLWLVSCGTNSGHLPSDHSASDRKLLVQKYAISWRKGIEEIDLTFVIPNSIMGRQKVEDTVFSIEPISIMSSDSSRYAKFLIKTKDFPESKALVEIRSSIGVWPLTKKNAAGLQGNPKQFLASEPMIQSADERIVRIARSLEAPTAMDTVENIHAYVRSQFDHIEHNTDLSALETLDRKAGDCSEFALLYAAIARACGIPSMVVTGINIDPSSNGPDYHLWNESYIPDYGWCRVDTTYPIYNYYYQPDHYIYLSTSPADPKLDGFELWTSRYKPALPDAVTIELGVTVK